MKKLKWLLPIAGIGIIALGIAAFIRPDDFLIRMALMFGIGMLVVGIFEIGAYFGQEKESRKSMLLTSGILAALMGIWVIFGRGSDVIYIILPFIFALWVMSSGITRIVDGISKKGAGSKSRGWQITLGIVGTMAGFALMFNPMYPAGVVLSYVIGTILIIQGMSTIIMFLLMIFPNDNDKGNYAV